MLEKMREREKINSPRMRCSLQSVMAFCSLLLPFIAFTLTSAFNTENSIGSEYDSSPSEVSIKIKVKLYARRFGINFYQELELFKRNTRAQVYNSTEKKLIQSWRTMDKMLSCTKIPDCARSYRQAVVTPGNNKRFLNLLQAMSMVLQRIKHLTREVKEQKRYFWLQYFVNVDNKSNYCLRHPEGSSVCPSISVKESLFFREQWRSPKYLG